jgi:hypothetical protein
MHGAAELPEQFGDGDGDQSSPGTMKYVPSNGPSSRLCIRAAVEAGALFPARGRAIDVNIWHLVTPYAGII